MRLLDSFSTHRIRNLEYRIGRVFPFGATITDEGVNFSIFSKEATSCTPFEEREIRGFEKIEVGARSSAVLTAW